MSEAVKGILDTGLRQDKTRDGTAGKPVALAG